MAQVRVRNVPERERIVRGMQDSKSLDEISQACGGRDVRVVGVLIPRGRNLGAVDRIVCVELFYRPEW